MYFLFVNKQTHKQTEVYICSGVPVEPGDSDSGAEVPGVLSGEVHESQDGARCVEPVWSNPRPGTWSTFSLSNPPGRFILTTE